MRLSEWIDALTHPSTGAFPTGISPKQMDQLANSQVSSSSIEHGIEFRPLWKSGNHLGVLLWNEVKAGRIFRLHKACYVGKTHKNMQENRAENNSTRGVSSQSKNTVELVQQRPAVASTCFDGKMNASAGVGKSVSATPATHEIPQPTVVSDATEENCSEMEITGTRGGFRCFVCNRNEVDVGNVALKCKECPYQSHLKCSYAYGQVPASLLSRSSLALLNWRCYDCKCCQLCSRKDDATDDLLLCDGCDTGEHMGCQNPPLAAIPPAPWYCSTCRSQRGSAPTCIVYPSSQQTHNDKTRSSNQVSAVTSALNEAISQPDGSVSSGLTVTKPNSACAEPAAEPMRKTSWTGVVNPDTPPLSDEASDSPTNHTVDDQTPATDTDKLKPIKIKLGKRPHSQVWERSDSQEDDVELQQKKRAKSDSSSGQVGEKPPDDKQTEQLLQQTAASAKDLKENGGDPTSSPITGNGLPSLGEEDTADIRGVKLWSVEHTAGFLERMGFAESALAFKREEVDGPALLLLQRQDVLHNLGIKLGPALKTYRLVRFIQTSARSQ